MAENGTTQAFDLALDAPAATVEALARALELHDYRRGSYGETVAHTTRVTQLGLQLAEQVAPELCLEPQLAFGFRLHDIGMIGVSNATLIKPGPLAPAEIDEIREHPWLGERIVAPVPALGGLSSFEPITEKVSQRHAEIGAEPRRAIAVKGAQVVPLQQVVNELAGEILSVLLVAAL